MPADRRTVWNPGVTYGGGGIPDRQQPCAQLTPSGGDDTAAIQDAVDACGQDQVVLLAAGTFRVTGEGLHIARSGITLRGAGSGAPGSGEGGTRLVKADRAQNTSSAVLYIGHNPSDFASSTDLAADALKGSTSVTLTSDPGLKVGEYVLVDHVTSGDPAVEWGTEHEPPGSGSRRWFARQDRSLSQIVEVTAVDGPTVTFATPLHWSFRTVYKAQLSRYGEHTDGPLRPFVEWVGVENIYVEGGAGGDYHGNIAMSTCAYCWVKAIESNHSVGTAVGMYGTYRSEIRDSYIHSTDDPNPGGAGYLTGVHYGGADNLIENNILWRGNKLIVMRASGGGNVVAYNYLEDGYGDGYHNIPEVGLNAAHYTTPHMELLEGNQSFNAVGESYWGNSVYITMYRNHITSARRDVSGIGLTDEVLRRIVVLDKHSYYYNFVGNVLGTPDMRLQGQQERFVVEGTQDTISDTVVPVWLLGHSGENVDEKINPKVAETTLRHGNFDFVSREVTWAPGLPKGLPPSLYLPSRPAFFGDNPWPWVRPEDGGAARGLPARERFDAIHGRG
ncbi:hypothetical protein Psuf_067810 [Phytohabitans suffuscus]|uniref:Pectate lyase superfamily protein domain-containing protein n=1 Tax=Phytohabitans suffuscus TaxID=624315 RepID=A0A6F8YU56_9ACTN|nr:hypothetical protein Psuf_067810 [Phytohabitans suffuscus]